jgi:hypothetical protein
MSFSKLSKSFFVRLVEAVTGGTRHDSDVDCSGWVDSADALRIMVAGNQAELAGQ